MVSEVFFLRGKGTQPLLERKFQTLVNSHHLRREEPPCQEATLQNLLALCSKRRAMEGKLCKATWKLRSLWKQSRSVRGLEADQQQPVWQDAECQVAEGVGADRRLQAGLNVSWVLCLKPRPGQESTASSHWRHPTVHDLTEGMTWECFRSKGLMTQGTVLVMRHSVPSTHHSSKNPEFLKWKRLRDKERWVQKGGGNHPWKCHV